MANHLLLPSQRNDIFLLIKEAGMAATEFRWQEAASRNTGGGMKVPQLLHGSSKYFYRFDLKDGKHFCECSPGRETLTRTEFPGNWIHQKHSFEEWLKDLRREATAPDLWSGVAQEAALFAATTSQDDNAPFTQDERGRIAISVNEIRLYFSRTHADDTERLRFVEDRLAYLVDSSERLGRKDWLNLAMGVVANIVVGAALAPDSARDLLRVVGVALGWLFGGSPLLPHPLH